MATTYRIIFENQHGEDGDYAFFTQKPIVDDNPNDPSCFTNIWIAEPVANEANLTIETTTQFYACKLAHPYNAIG